MDPKTETLQVSPSPDSHLLMYLKEKELRLSRGKLPVHRAAQNTDSYLNPINPFNPANLKEHEDVVALKQKQNQTITPFSCKRQKFEAKCEGTKRTQIVLRWFAKNGECCSYPYGFCPGTTIKEDQTLRTKEECETFCLSSQSEIEKSFEDSGAATSSPVEVMKEPSASESSTNSPTTEPATSDDKVVPEMLSEPLPPTPSPHFPTLANPIQGEVSNTELEEVFPPGYGPEIDEENKTRVILHSEIQEPISIAPPNAESDAHAKELIFEMSMPQQPLNERPKEGSANELSVQELTETTTTATAAQVTLEKVEMETENAQNKDLKVLKKPQPGGLMKSKVAEKVGPKKSCQKLIPYRSMCPRTGMPSQFTLRWFVKAGMCCAYPFGYCHGDSVFEEAAIKTKLECEELCLGRVDSEKPYHHRI